MAEIQIPFKEGFKFPLLDGVKICTSRTKRMGKEGDTFWAFGQQFAIERIHHIPLAAVVPLWKEEGCLSADDFVAVWNAIHPRKGYLPDQLVYLHWFRKLAYGVNLIR